VNTLLINILLAFAWMFLSGDLNFMNFLEGMLIGYIILFISRRAINPGGYFTKLPRLISFILFFLKELIVANIMVAYDIITPEHKMKPAIVGIPLDAKTDIEITILANMITLTPGTLSIDVSHCKTVLYVHTMYLEGTPDEFKASIKNGLEKKLLEVTR
jgi:multicomponent Na+:H+ antiporter subunit E